MTLEKKLLVRKYCNVISFMISLLFMIVIFTWGVKYRSIPMCFVIIPFANTIFLIVTRVLTNPYK